MFSRIMSESAGQAQYRRLRERRLTNTVFLAAVALLAFGCEIATGQDLSSLFNSDIEAPFLSHGVDAEAAETDELANDPLEARFLKMQRELDQLKAALDARSEQEDLPKNVTPAPVTYPTVKLNGFLQVDAGWFHQDTASLATLGDIQDDRGFRRTRLITSGKVAENVSYLLDLDFAQAGRPSFLDVYMDIAKVPVLGNVRIGQYRVPFGMDEFTNGRELTFLERPLTRSLAPFRQIAVGFHDTTTDENVTWAAAAFGTNTDPWGSSIGDRGYGIAERLTAVLLEDASAEFLVHGGLAHSYIATPNGKIQYRSVPEYNGPINVPGSVPNFVDTGLIPAENANLFNGELAATWGSWHAQSEMRYSVVNLNSGGVAGFPSFYVQTAYILTGEHRPYDKTKAVFGRVKPNHPARFNGGGIGAWELAWRYSMVDLTNGAIQGGELHDMTYGVNWYLNNFTKLQFNYISADLNRALVGDSHTDLFVVRAQVDF